MVEQFCRCENSSSAYSETDDFGLWDRCCNCDKVIEDSFEYLNHYDSEDHCNN